MPGLGEHYGANDIPLANFNLPPIETPSTNPTIQPVEASATPEPVPARPRKSIVQTFKGAIVAALGGHDVVTTSINAAGKEVTHVRKSKDVFEVEQRDFAERRLTESKNKWDPKAMEGLNGWQKFGKKAEHFFDRMWRGMGAEEAHRAKEKAFGAELSATIGIDSAISEEFNAIIDKEARKRIDAKRSAKKGGKFWGALKDGWANFTATRQELHVEELAITRELRDKYDRNPANSDPIENPLYALINRDVAARESLAARVNESDLELLKQTNAGDKKTTVAIKLDSPEGKVVETFLKEKIIGKAIDDFVTRKQAGENVTGINGKLRRELDLDLQNFMFTPEFEAWRKTLPAEQQALFENSFTYASDMLLQTEEVMLPAVLENLDHYAGPDKLNFEMELCLGTAQLTANTEETRDVWFTQERASLNQKLMDRMRGERNTTPNSRLYDTQVVQTGLKWGRTLSYVDMIAKNEALVAWGSALAGKAALTVARSGLSWIPGVGSALVTGTSSGLKEWGRMGKQRSTYGFGVANGLEFPVANQAVRSEQMRKADYHRIQLGRRTQQLSEVMDKFKAGDPDVNTIFMGMAYVADSGARLKLNGERNINLLTASVDGPEGRGIYARELRVHDLARAAVTKQLGEILRDDTKRGEIAAMMGIVAGEPNDYNVLLTKLTIGQYDNLLSGTQVDGALKALITAGDKDLIRAKSEAIRARDEDFRKMRWGSSLKYGATSAVIAGVASFGLGKVFHHEETISNTLTQNHEVVLVNHALPNHEDALTTAQIFDNHGNVVTETHSWLPAGTHLDLVQKRVGGPDDLEISYNLVTDNTKDQVLLHGITFGSHGEIVNQAALATEMAQNHIKIDPHELAAVNWGQEAVPGSTEIDYTQWTNTLHYKDFPGQDIDGYFAKHINESLALHPEINNAHETLTNVERVTDINGMRNFLRGMENWVYKQQNFKVNQIEGYHRILHTEDTMWSKLTGHQEVISEGQTESADILHVPDLFATQGGIRRVVDLVHESIRENPTGDIHHQFSDEAHRIAWEMSYWGDEAHIPDAIETRTLLEYFGEIPVAPVAGGLHSVIPIENYFTVSEDITTLVPVHTNEVFTQTVADMWTHLAAIGYSHPLEAPVSTTKDQELTSEYYLGYYGDKPSEEKLKRFKQIRSESLTTNPNAVLDDRKEIDNYLTKLQPEYLARISELAKQAGTISPDTKLSILIPVADHQEEKNIFKSLENYAHQTASPKDYEIVLLLNHPEHDSAGKNINSDGTEAEIKRFAQQYPNIPVKIIKMVMPFEEAKIGYIRKYLADVALLRQQQRYQSLPQNSTTKPLIMVSNDADNMGVSSDYIANFIRKFEENPQVESYLGQLDWDPEAYAKYPLIHVGTRLFQYLAARGRRNSGGMPSSGANFAYKSNIYAAIGGYIPDLSAGEDIAIGQAIIAGRQSNHTIKYAGAGKSRIYTSARRAVDALTKHGLSPVEQWNKGFSSFDDEIRRLQVGGEKDIDYSNSEELANLKVGLESVINRTIDTYEAGETISKDAEYYRQALDHLGIEYFVKDGQIEISDMSTLIRGLKHYQLTGQLLQKIKSKQGTAEEIEKAREKLKEIDIAFQTSIQAEETKVTTERQNRAAKIDSELNRFLSTENLEMSDIPDLRYGLEELKQSTRTEEHGNFIMCLDKPLGKGQMGEVVAGYNKQTGQLVAFKRISKAELKDISRLNEYPENIVDIEDEVKKISNNLVLGTYLDKIDEDDKLIKISALEATDLHTYLESGKTLSPKQAVNASIRILSGLREMHKNNMAHLDVIATNVLLSKDSVRLTDFDASSIKKSSEKKFKRGFVGGDQYILPPELFIEGAPIRESADTYEMAALMYRMMTNNNAITIHKIGTEEEQRVAMYKKHLEGNIIKPDSIPEEVWAIIQKGMRPLPKDRYQTADEMLEDMLEIYKKL